MVALVIAGDYNSGWSLCGSSVRFATPLPSRSPVQRGEPRPLAIEVGWLSRDSCAQVPSRTPDSASVAPGKCHSFRGHRRMPTGSGLRPTRTLPTNHDLARTGNAPRPPAHLLGEFFLWIVSRARYKETARKRPTVFRPHITTCGSGSCWVPASSRHRQVRASSKRYPYLHAALLRTTKLARLPFQ